MYSFRVFRVLVNGLPVVCSLLQGHQKIYISGCSDVFLEISLFTGETDPKKCRVFQLSNETLPRALLAARDVSRERHVSREERRLYTQANNQTHGIPVRAQKMVQKEPMPGFKEILNHAELHQGTRTQSL